MAENLPPLPPTVYTLFYEAPAGDEEEGWQEVVDAPGYTEKQVREYAIAYAAEAVKAERKACAKLAMTTTETGNKYPMTASDQLRLDIAAAIRARKDNHG